MKFIYDHNNYMAVQAITTLDNFINAVCIASYVVDIMLRNALCIVY